MILSAQDVRNTIKTQCLAAWTVCLLTNIAESLESLEKRLAFKQVELDQRNVTLSQFQKALDNSIPLSRYNESQVQVQQYAAQVVNLKKERDKLATELAALRPPEPKFKVGQVVANKNYNRYYRIAENREPANGLVTYWGVVIESCNTPASGRIWERDLRELTPQEKGETELLGSREA